MGRIFKVELPLPDNSTRYFLCRSCYVDSDVHTHIVLDEHCLYTDEVDGDDVLVVRQPVNLVVDEDLRKTAEGQYQVADVSCVQCMNHLGFKIIDILDYNNDPLHKDYVLLYKNKVVMWNGQHFIETPGQLGTR